MNLFYLILFYFILFYNNATASSRIFKEISGSPVLIYSLDLNSGTHTVETKNLVSLTGYSPDSVLYVLESLSGNQIAWDDDSGNAFASKVTFFLLSPKRVTILVRAYSTSSIGLCDLQIDGVVPATMQGHFFGGAVVSTWFPGSANNDYHVVLQNGQLTNTQLFVLDCDDSSIKGIDLEQRGVGSGSFIENKSNVCAAVISTGWGKKVTLYVNDKVDNDGDGLGSLLEEQLKTCDHHDDVRTFVEGNQTRNFLCSNVVNLKDSDSDGIPDNVEVFGIENASNPNAPMLFPSWGANPLHKDLFIEVDYAGDYLPVGEQYHLFKYLDNGIVQESDLRTALEKVQSYFNNANSSNSLNNPDGSPGISLHFDVGVSPSSYSQSTLFGDWGGSNVIPKNTLSHPGNTINSEMMWLKYSFLAKESSTNFFEIEQNVFVQGLGFFEDSRKNFFNYIIYLPYDLQKLSFFDPNYSYIGFIPGGGLGKARLLAHEIGHLLGLSHGGNPETGTFNCKPNYMSLMNYAIASSDFDAFNTQNSGILNNASFLELESTKVPCGYSGLSYLTDTAPSSSFRRKELSPTCSSPYPPYVDWNFNNSFDFSSYKSVRASLFWNYRCENFQNYNNNERILNVTFPPQIPSEDRYFSKPAIFRIGGKLYITSIDQNQRISQRFGDLKLVSSGNDVDGSCQVGQGHTMSQSCVSWSEDLFLLAHNGLPIENVESHAIIKSVPSIWVSGYDAFLAYQQGGNIYFSSLMKEQAGRLTQSSSALLVVSDALISSNSSDAKNAGIELVWLRVNPAEFNGKKIILALFYVRADGVLSWSTKESEISPWVNKGFVRYSSDLFASANISSFSPSISNVPHLVNESMTTCGLFSRTRESFTGLVGFDLRCYDHSSSVGYWKLISTVNNSQYKPSLAFHTPRYSDGEQINAHRGVFFVTFSSPDENNTFNLLVQVSEAFNSSDALIQNAMLFDKKFIQFYSSESAHSFYASIFEDSEISALKSVSLEKKFASPQNGFLRFFPFADGTYRLATLHKGALLYDIRSEDDFHTMGKKLCENLNSSSWPCTFCSILLPNSCPSGSYCDWNGRCISP